MSSPALDMKDAQPRLNGALWASHHPAKHGRMSMKIAIGAALLVELLLVVGLSRMSFHTEPPPARQEMRIEMPPPPPPPPPPVKKIEPPAPPKPIDTTPPKPKPPTAKPPPAKPTPVPQEAVIPAAANPAADAPALATAPSTATGPAKAATGAPPAPAPLHGVVDGRGHCTAVQPTIPRKALQDGISADVIAHLTINPDGSVGDVKIVRVSPPTTVFNEAVIAAGKAYKCEANAEPYVGEVNFSFKTTAPSDDE
jgi:periplasmic protein TonB